jgi:hypothetical protein
MRTLAILLITLSGAAVAAAQDTMPPRPAPATATLTVEPVLARSVVDRVPQDSGTTFPADVGELILWTKVSGGTADQTIHHVWFRGDEQVADVELRLGGSPWRTWSRKTIPADATGAWRVEVRNAAGDVLQRIEFTIGGATGA